jgi:hypothetical protein
MEAHEIGQQTLGRQSIAGLKASGENCHFDGSDDRKICWLMTNLDRGYPTYFLIRHD